MADFENNIIVLNKNFVNWQWYDDRKTTAVFLHLLLTANCETNDFFNISVNRGETVISYHMLASQLHLSVQEVRTAIRKLKQTNEITVKKLSHYTVVSIVNYDQYQYMFESEG